MSVNKKKKKKSGCLAKAGGAAARIPCPWEAGQWSALKSTWMAGVVGVVLPHPVARH